MTLIYGLSHFSSFEPGPKPQTNEFHLLIILFPLYLPNEVESKHIYYKLKYIWSALYKHSGREGFMKFWMKFKFAYFLKCENLNSRFMYSIVNNVIDPFENYMLKKC